MNYTNPILAGFYPDPSVCRRGGRYYLVTTSQEFFPGIPVFESGDLVHWRQVGHVLDRPEETRLDTAGDSQGVCAPTIRFFNDRFWVTSTLVRHEDDGMFVGSFVCTADDPAGPWSGPHWIDGATGLDPSLFRDDDGRIYWHANDWVRPARTPLHRIIWAQELDAGTLRLTGQRRTLLDAADWVPLYGADGCASFDGPHIYRKDGWYWLLIAAGDTHWNHSTLLFRSRNVFGPWEPCPRNPIMTHRDLPKEAARIACVGHADLIQDPGGGWWAFFLATRPHAAQVNYLGRETFLAPVDWSGDWPVVSPVTGRIEMSYPAPQVDTGCHGGRRPPPCRDAATAEIGGRDDFDQPELGFQWSFIRTPREAWWRLDERPGHLRLRLRPVRLDERANPSFIGRRVQHMAFSARTKMEFTPQADHEEAGMGLYRSGKAYFRLVVRTQNGKRLVRLVARLTGDDTDREAASAEIPDGALHLRIDAVGETYRFGWSADGEAWQFLDHAPDVSCLSQTVCGGYTGIYVGLFVGSNRQASDTTADFDWFEYKPLTV